MSRRGLLTTFGEHHGSIEAVAVVHTGKSLDRTTAVLNGWVGFSAIGKPGVDLHTEIGRSDRAVLRALSQFSKSRRIADHREARRHAEKNRYRHSEPGFIACGSTGRTTYLLWAHCL